MDKIASKEVNEFDNGETVAISSFWSKALMQKHIRCVAIVQEKEEIEDLKNRNLWNGELFYTLDKSVYADLGIQSTNSWNLFSSLFCKKSHTMVNEANAIPGDFHGDLYQLGGVFVVDKTGQCLYEFRQNSFTVSPDVQTVARVCNVPYNGLSEDEENYQHRKNYNEPSSSAS
ncbi:Prostamide/prostaglandin F synthase [Trichinella pseudospiralis]